MLRSQPGRIGKDIILYRYYGDSIQVVNFREDGVGVITTLEPGGDYANPTIRTSQDADTEDIFQAFTEAGQEFGIKRPDESFTAGKLEATERHLSDMRSIVFKNGPENLSS